MTCYLDPCYSGMTAPNDTLLFGTLALVINHDNGGRAVVAILDRRPYAPAEW
jgi:rare lipoprotein A (peptidoglycan hydrolase)